MRRQVVFGIGLIILSTLCYYVPTYFVNLSGFDLNTVPRRFYDHFAWKTTGAFLLTAIYAICFFLYVDPKDLFLKLTSCWLAIAESLTAINHFINKFIKFQAFNGYEAVSVLIIFGACCLLFLSRALSRQHSDLFDEKKTYIIRFLLKSTLGIFNYLCYRSGHYAIYQGGYIYRFRRSTGKIEKFKTTEGFFQRMDISFQKIEHIEGVEDFVGRTYNIFKYNCNHMVKDVQKRSKTE